MRLPRLLCRFPPTLKTRWGSGVQAATAAVSGCSVKHMGGCAASLLVTTTSHHHPAHAVFYAASIRREINGGAIGGWAAAQLWHGEALCYNCVTCLLMSALVTSRLARSHRITFARRVVKSRGTTNTKITYRRSPTHARIYACKLCELVLTKCSTTQLSHAWHALRHNTHAATQLLPHPLVGQSSQQQTTLFCLLKQKQRDAWAALATTVCTQPPLSCPLLLPLLPLLPG